MIEIEIRTYRVQGDSDPGTLFQLGIKAGAEGFTHTYSLDDNEMVFLTKEPLTIGWFDSLTEFNTGSEEVSCTDDGEEYEYDEDTSLLNTIEELFYSNNATIKLPKENVILKIENVNSY
jgi:hypothetical protein